MAGQVYSICVHCYIAIISRLICTNMQLMQLARIETMCNDGVHSLERELIIVWLYPSQSSLGDDNW